MAKSIEQLVRELADREGIRELPLKYCDCVWRNDTQGIVNLFAEDGKFRTVGLQQEYRLKGREALLEFYRGLTQRESTPRPFIHNHVIELKGYDRAAGRCYVEVRNAKMGMELSSIGYYDDEYLKIGQDWKFKSRAFSAAYQRASHTP